MQIAMHHEGIDTVAFAVDEDSFNAVWRPRGWVLLGHLEAYASEQLGKLVVNVDELTIDELYQLCALRHAEPVELKAKKADHLASFTATFDEGFAPVEPAPVAKPPSTPAPQEPPAPKADVTAATSAT